MDANIFERRIKQLEDGEFVRDPSLFEYADNAVFELKRLFSALKICCDWQSQKIEILRKLNSGLERSIREQKARIALLEDKLKEAGIEPDLLQ